MSTRTLDSDTASHLAFLSWKDGPRSRLLEIGEFLTLGRESGNHIILDDPFTSSRHARIERKPQGFFLRDLRSRNGTFLNGARIFEAMIKDGDRIRIGQTDLAFSANRPSDSTVMEPTSKNAAWRSRIDRLPAMAEAAFPILLTGPSGSGKDLIAQTLHRVSPRKGNPFISVNCSALSESLVESELFGHVKGSFTGATSDRKGAFEAARGGTLFLDEIGDLPLSLQPKLLRALENNQIRPVGSDRTVDTDVRIIAATHHDLRRLVYDELFRADLYFRLHVIQLEVPALRDRMEDFEDLLYFFSKQMRVRFSFAAVQQLKRHTWPGNIRELRNSVARAKALLGSNEVTENDVALLIDHLPERGRGGMGEFRPSRSVIKEIEYEMIKSRLIANRGNQRKTALDLGMPKSTLHDRIKVYGIDVAKLVEDLG